MLSPYLMCLWLPKLLCTSMWHSQNPIHICQPCQQQSVGPHPWLHPTAWP